MSETAPPDRPLPELRGGRPTAPRGFVFRRLERVSKGISRQGLYEFLDREYARIAPGWRVLTVGAGGPINERLAAHAARRPFTVLSLDLDARRSPDLVGDLCETNLGESQFDAVVLGEVLEHVYAPHLALANVRRALRPGGRLLVTVPFLFPLHNRPVDYYRFTRYGLEFLLREFEDVRVEERNSWAEALNVLLVRHHRERNARARALAPLLTGWAYLQRPLASLIGRLAPSDMMTTGYVATARKPAGTVRPVEDA